MAVLRETFRYWVLSFLREPADVVTRGFESAPMQASAVVLLTNTWEEVGRARAWIASTHLPGQTIFLVIPPHLIDAPEIEGAESCTVLTLDRCIQPILSALGEDGSFVPGEGELTTRERQVLQLIAQGAPAKEISYRLGISQHTVVSYRRSLYLKTGARSLQQLALYATMHVASSDNT